MTFKKINEFYAAIFTFVTYFNSTYKNEIFY